MRDSEQTNLDWVFNDPKIFVEIFKSSPDPMLLIEGDQFVFANQAALDMLMLNRLEDFIGCPPFDISPTFQPNGKSSEALAKEIMSKHAPAHFEWQHRRFDGSLFWVDVSLSPFKHNNREMFLCIWKSADVRKNNESLAVMHEIVFQHADEAILVTDAQNRIIEINPAFEKMTGYTREEVLYKNPSILASGREPTDFYKNMWKEIEATGKWTGILWDRRKDGHVYPKKLIISTVFDSFQIPLYRIGMFSDASEHLEQVNKLSFEATHDPLTGLNNRTGLIRNGEHLQIVASDLGKRIFVLFIDLDGFKKVNDTHGHYMGDILLQIVSSRIMEIVRESDIVSRLGGDEFAIVSMSDHPDQMASRILSALNKPYQIESSLIYDVSASIGVAEATPNMPFMSLLNNADLAMYKAKTVGKNNVQFSDK